MTCSNHVVINAPKRGRLKVHLALKLYFGVMTMWLVELTSGDVVYLRILVLSAHDGDVRPPHFIKCKGVVFRRFEGFSFGLLRVVGKTARLRGVCVDKCHVGMPLPSLTLLPFPLRPPKMNLVCVLWYSNLQ